jgi:2-methylcitrate dehydratase PrpD
VGLQSFLLEALVDPAVLALSARIEVIANARVGTDIGAKIRLQLKSGATREREVSVPLGSPAHPLSRTDLVAKFVECAGLALKPLSNASANQLAEVILNLDSLEDVSRDLTPLLHID